MEFLKGLGFRIWGLGGVGFRGFGCMCSTSKTGSIAATVRITISGMPSRLWLLEGVKVFLVVWYHSFHIPYSKTWHDSTIPLQT